MKLCYFFLHVSQTLGIILTDNFYPSLCHCLPQFYRDVSPKNKNKKPLCSQTAATHHGSMFATLFLTDSKYAEYTDGFFLANPKASLKFSSFLTSLQGLTLLNLLLFLRCFIPVASIVGLLPYISYYSSGFSFFFNTSSYAYHPSHGFSVARSISSLIYLTQMGSFPPFGIFKKICTIFLPPPNFIEV